MTHAGTALRIFVTIMLLTSTALLAQQAEEDTLIEAQALDTALQAVAEEYDLQLLYESALVANLSAQAIPRGVSSETALNELLEDTNLAYQFVNEHTVTIKEKESPKEQEPGKSQPASNQTLIAQAGTPAQQVQATATAATDSGVEKTKAGRNVIEEVIVMARKREENIQDVPISITTFSAEELDARNFTDLINIADVTPNMQFTIGTNANGGGNEANIFIRGIGQRDGTITSDSGVAIYLDGVYLARAQGGVMDLVDIERIEVLRGPQGTLFGKNTVGGAVNIITSKPNGEFGGKMRVMLGSFDRIDVDGVVNFPLVEDQLFAKLAFANRDRDGYVERVLTGEADSNENRQTVRGSLRWLPTDRVEALFTLDYTRERERAIGYTPMNITGSVLVEVWNAATGDIFDDRWVPDDPYKINATGQSVNDSDTWGTSLTVDWDLEWGSVRSITAYRDYDFKFMGDADGSPIPLSDNDPMFVNGNQFSQELQIAGLSFNDRLTWLAGFYYFNEAPSEAIGNRIARGLFEALEAAPGLVWGPFGGEGNPFNRFLDITADTTTKVKNDTYAFFAQGTFDVTDRISLTAGARYNYDKKTFSYRNYSPRTEEIVLDIVNNKNSWESFTPRFEIAYKASDEQMFYGNISRGFKAGGFNPNPANEVSAEPYDEEFVWAYEVGYKSLWLNDRLRFNTAFYFNDYTGIQLITTRLDPSVGALILVENAGDAEIKGFELEMTARPTDSLDFSAGIGYTDAKYTDLKEGAFVTKDMLLPQTPKWTVNISGQYTVLLQNASTVSMRVDYQYIDDFMTDPENEVSTMQKGYSTVNARLAYIDVSGSWEVSLFGTNLTDTAAITNAFFSRGGGMGAGIYRPPRQWAVSLAYHF